MDRCPSLITQPSQPWKPRMTGVRDAAWNVKMKYRFGSGSMSLGKPAPLGIALPCGRATDSGVPDKVYVHAVFVRRPMTLEILKECRPVICQSVPVKILT